jgi:hypothetical protein
MRECAERSPYELRRRLKHSHPEQQPVDLSGVVARERRDFAELE